MNKLVLSDLPPEVQKQIKERTGRRVQSERWPMDEVRRYAIRCLNVLADLTPAQRRRVLAHAVKLNDL